MALNTFKCNYLTPLYVKELYMKISNYTTELGLSLSSSLLHGYSTEYCIEYSSITIH